ncbi:hypothetical protein ACFCWG_42900 [Streptomyces sp. NPDC056390]|uniref:hypothetical protein n=1 Tax=Streptomyces sp. NPDC056390 TaxID=3345806 RepID=UPI0035E042A2
MIGAASFSPAHRRMWNSSVLVVLLWTALHLLGCAHSHGPAIGAHHDPMSATVVTATSAAATSSMSIPDSTPCCPETGEHTMDRIRSDVPLPPVHTAASPVDVRPSASSAVLSGSATARPAGARLLGGRCILTALCVART